MCTDIWPQDARETKFFALELAAYHHSGIENCYVTPRFLEMCAPLLFILSIVPPYSVCTSVIIQNYEVLLPSSGTKLLV